MEQIIVGVAECGIGDEPEQEIATYGLGSCIAVAAYDPVARVGGLAHYMLPDSSVGMGRVQSRPWAFADIAIPLLLEQLIRLGADRRRLRVHAAGGARMIGGNGSLDIGRKNAEALLRELSRVGLKLDLCALGGAVSRNMRLSVGTGRVRIWEGGGANGG